MAKIVKEIVIPIVSGTVTTLLSAFLSTFFDKSDIWLTVFRVLCVIFLLATVGFFLWYRFVHLRIRKLRKKIKTLDKQMKSNLFRCRKKGKSK
jgi:uncharacterized BrkB/YihY/UPF0761 family membrane protein